MAYSKDLYSHVTNDVKLVSQIGVADKDTLNGTIQYTDSIKSKTAFGWDVELLADIAACAVAVPVITLVYSESADDSSWDTAVEIKEFTYTKAAGSVVSDYAYWCNPEDFTKAYVKFGWSVDLDATETGTFSAGLLATGIGVRDISLETDIQIIA